MIIILDEVSYGAITETAEAFGWEDPFEDRDYISPQDADAVEDSAIDYLKQKEIYLVNEEVSESLVDSLENCEEPYL